MNLPSMAKFATIKGLNVLGTGDFTHPAWLREIETSLVEVEGSGLFTLHKRDFPMRFMLTAEVYTNFMYEGKS
ncbi:MAG: DNA helicase UvrD, partial [Candidatus Bathyarchaeia archaeon]